MDIQKIKKDAALITEGQWIGDIPDMGDLILRVRGASSPVVVACRARKQRAVPRDERLRDGSLSIETQIRIETEVLHEAVLLEWGGLTDGGEPVKYDEELAREWLTNPDYRSFADAVVWASAVADRGVVDQKEKTAKNS